MRNILQVDFVFNERDGNAKLENVHKKLHETGKQFDQIGDNFGDKISREFGKMENAGLNSLSRIKNATNDIESAFAKPFAQPVIADFDKIGSKITETRIKLSQIAGERLSSGGATNLTKEITLASDRARLLERDIRSIQSELTNPNRKSSIKFLTDELKAAESEADRLNKKLSSLPKAQTPNVPRGGGRSGALTDKQLTALEIFDDFAPAGLNRPFNAIARAGLSAQNIKEANGEMTILSRLSLATLGTFGAIAATGFVIVDATSKIREQAEKRLLNENLISGAINRQILGLKKIKEDYEKFERSLEKDKSFSDRLTSSINTSDASAITREREKIRAENRSRGEEINRLQSDLEQKERSLDFAKNRNVRQSFITEYGLAPEYTASQKQQDVAQAESAVEKTRRLLAESENALEKGKAALQQTDKALTDITERQNKAFSNRFEIFQKSQNDSEKFDRRQFETLEKKKKKIEEIQLLRAEFNSFQAESAFPNNPFVKLFADAESAAERMEKRFKTLGGEYVRLATTIEQNSIAKKIGEQSFQSNLKAIDYEQEAFRVSRIRDNQFTSFQNALNTVEKKLDFAVNMFEINKKIDESDFFAYSYNPNNPKTFDESRFSFGQLDRFGDSADGRRRGESVQDYEKRRLEAVQSAIRVNDAFDEINKLKSISLEGTGIFGQGAIAEKILERFPSQEDLLRQLSSPYAAFREGAQSLLADQSNALRTKRELEDQKLQDFVYDQETAGLSRKFAYDKLAELNKRQGLSKGEYAENFLDITRSLGNDIDPFLRRAQVEQNFTAAQFERDKRNDAAKQLSDIYGKLDAIYKQLGGVISNDGVKTSGTVALDGDSKNAVAAGSEVIIRDKRANSTGSSGSDLDVATNYNLIEGLHNSFGGGW